MHSYFSLLRWFPENAGFGFVLGVEQGHRTPGQEKGRAAPAAGGVCSGLAAQPVSLVAAGVGETREGSCVLALNEEHRSIWEEGKQILRILTSLQTVVRQKGSESGGTATLTMSF